ncbi:MAG TPA: hypothetical protein VF533_04540 [Solirubrobacteraceae bacterium]|jgi:acyl-CoA reductase-like NAD-dependent aldehyde dehydrogenase
MSENGFEYDTLTPEDRLGIVQERLRQLEAEHYNAALTRRAAEQASDVGAEQRDEMLRRIDAQLQTLEAAIRLHRDERARFAAG